MRGTPGSFRNEQRMNHITIRSIERTDEDAVASLLEKSWGCRMVVSRCKVYDAANLPGFLAFENGEIVGLLTFARVKDSCEVITLDAFRPGKGIGSQLLDEAQAEAKRQGCRRLWLITTNNNLDAIKGAISQ